MAATTQWRLKVGFCVSTWTWVNYPLLQWHTVLGWAMRVGQLTAVLNFSSCTQFIQGFWGCSAAKTVKTRWSGGRVQDWFQVWGPAWHLAITTEGSSRRQSIDCKSNGQDLRASLAGWTGKHKYRALVLVNCVPLLWFWLQISLRVKRF